MLKSIIIIVLSLISIHSNAQNLQGIKIKKKLTIEYKNKHSCITQTRAETKEEAVYNEGKCGPVKYKLSKRGRLFKIYEKNDKNKWYEWGSYVITKSFEDKAQDELRFNLLSKDGSMITYMPELKEGPLVILDLSSEEVIHYIYD